MREWAYFGATSIAGQVAKPNQDAFFHHPSGWLDENGLLAVLCDGVSSVAHGGWAASTCCQLVQELSSVQSLPSALVEIDWEIRGKGKGHAACTLALVWIVGQKAYVFRVGDTQVYLLRNRSAHAIFPAKRDGALRSFVGIGDDILQSVQTEVVPLQSDDVLFLSTDGVSDMLQTSDLYTLWSHSYEDPLLCSARLVQLAQVNGSIDDNSVVTVHYQIR